MSFCGASFVRSPLLTAPPFLFAGRKGRLPPAFAARDATIAVGVDHHQAPAGTVTHEAARIHTVRWRSLGKLEHCLGRAHERTAMQIAKRNATREAKSSSSWSGKASRIFSLAEAEGLRYAVFVIDRGGLDRFTGGAEIRFRAVRFCITCQGLLPLLLSGRVAARFLVALQPSTF